MEKFSSKKNKEFWNKYAIKIKNQKHGAHSDPNLVEIENKFIINQLKFLKPNSLLDAGCGNGQRTLLFQKYVKNKIVGIDYSKEMIKQAENELKKQNNAIKKKVSFSVSTINEIENKFNAIISCRCIQNQPSVKKQIQFFEKAHNVLNKNGRLIIAEETLQGRNNLNTLRKKFGLKKIDSSWFNLPIDEKRVFPKILDIFKIEKIRRTGMYYYLTRVIHPIIVYPENPNPQAEINKVAAQAEKIFTEEEFLEKNFLEEFGAELLISFVKK